MDEWQEERSEVMRTWVVWAAWVLSMASMFSHAATSALPQGPTGAKEILAASGVKGGLVVCMGCDDADLIAGLRANRACVVHALDSKEDVVAKTRAQLAAKAGVYGPVSVATFGGAGLPYIDNLVNLLVLSGDHSKVSDEEIRRVLAPLGVAIAPKGARSGEHWKAADPKNARFIVLRKPWPESIDEWPQYLRGADNNAVAQDTVVGPPRHMQWVSTPAWSRSHMGIPSITTMVSAGGRLFTIEDVATPENPFLPGRFQLIARDAFNGIVLWRQHIPVWEPITRYVKDIAIQLQRRLVATRETVYCTPGLKAPLTAFDAATGKVIRTFEGTKRTQEFALYEGVLYAVIGDRMNSARYNIVKTHAGKGESLGGSDPKAPFGGTGFRGAYAPESANRATPICDIVAIDATSGEERWRQAKIRSYTGCSLALRGKYAVYQHKGGLVCLDRKTGKDVWRVKKQIKSADGTEANTVILSDTMVYAQESTTLHAYALKDGSPKWKAPIANNYEKTADLFLIGDTIWTGGSKQPASYDAETGVKKTEIPQRMNGPMGHDRCYRNFITKRFYINSKTGGADFLDLATKKEFPNHWTRGTCGMGVLPCNGLIYVPPYSCQCSIGAMIKNFNAMYTEKGLASSEQAIKVEAKACLIKGPAYPDKTEGGEAKGDPSPAEGKGDWPTYRHDGTRGGATKEIVPPSLKPLWTANIGTAPTAPVIANGKVFVADTEGYCVYALDAASGNVAWRHAVGGRVDSPPTVREGLVLFGSRDGWVHCLRASDGAVVWRFRDLPERLIGAFDRLESVWPIHGSVLIVDKLVYFAAGRSSFLDGGIFLYGLKPRSGEVVHRRQVYGPFDAKTGFPAVRNRGFKADILVTDGERLFMRHRSFAADLKGTSPAPHVIPSPGFLDPAPQHRTYWTLDGSGGFSGKTSIRGASGDILVTDGKSYYEVRGFPVARHSYFDPRVKGYRLVAGDLGAGGASKASSGEKTKGRKEGGKKEKGKKGKGKKGKRGGKAPLKWSSSIPLTGNAMVLAGEALFVAGVPAYFPPDHPVKKYEDAYAGKLGGLLWVASRADGKKLAQHKLAASPVWDGMAVANGRLYVSLRDGSVLCMGKGE